MSYDICFRIPADDSEHFPCVDDLYEGTVDTGYCEANITWNVGEMIRRSTGLEWKNEADNGLVKDIIPAIALGLAELERNRQKYKKYEAPNGWGTINGTIAFFRTILCDWEVLKNESPELAGKVRFWIL